MLEATVYKLAVAVVFGVIAGAGLYDLTLALEGRYTVSDFLRERPSWFWWPALAALAFLVGLYLHLYVWPEK